MGDLPTRRRHEAPGSRRLEAAEAVDATGPRGARFFSQRERERSIYIYIDTYIHICIYIYIYIQVDRD